MRISSSIFSVVFAIFIARTSLVHWQNLDGQTFNTLFPDQPYEAVFAGKLWTALVLAFASLAIFRNRRTASGIPRSALVFLGYALISASWSVAPASTIYGALNLAVLILLPATAVQVMGSRHAVLSLFYTCALILIISVSLALFGSELAIMQGVHAGLWRGIFNHKNAFAPFAATVFLFCVLHRGDFIPKLFRVFVGVTSLLSLIMCGSATSVIGTSLAMLFGLRVALRSRMHFLSFAIVCFCILTFMIVFAFFAHPHMVIFDEFGLDLTFTNRTLLWSVAVDQMNGRWLGFGFSSAGGDFVSFAIKSATGLLQGSSLQSAFVQTFVDLGLVGLALLLSFYVCIIRFAFASSQPGLIIALVTLHACVSAAEVIGGLYGGIMLVPIFVIFCIDRLPTKTPKFSRWKHRSIHSS